MRIGGSLGLLILAFCLGGYLIWSLNTFRFSGMVVDESGQPVSGVLLEVLEARRKKMGFETDYVDRIQRLNGGFATRVWRADSVDLIFTAPGYQFVRMHFDRPGAHHGLTVVMKRD